MVFQTFLKHWHSGTRYYVPILVLLAGGVQLFAYRITIPDTQKFIYNAPTAFSTAEERAIEQASSTADLHPRFNQAKTFVLRTKLGATAAGFSIKIRNPQQKSYCLGQEIPIIWDASNNFEVFRIMLYAHGSYFPIANISGTSTTPNDSTKEYNGTYLWTVGDVYEYRAAADQQHTYLAKIPLGFDLNQAYFIEILGEGGLGSMSGHVRADSEVFFMTQCEG